jgi:hypothetical protein
MSGRTCTTATKDRRHKLFYEVLAPGIIIVYMKKFNKNEEPYLQPLYKILYDHEDIKNGLRVIAEVPRPAADGDTNKLSKEIHASMSDSLNKLNILVRRLEECNRQD